MFLPDTNPRNSVAPRTSGPRAKNRTSHAMDLERGHIKLKTLPWAEARFGSVHRWFRSPGDDVCFRRCGLRVGFQTL